MYGQNFCKILFCFPLYRYEKHNLPIPKSLLLVDTKVGCKNLNTYTNIKKAKNTRPGFGSTCVEMCLKA